MINTTWLAPLAGLSLVRRTADAVMVQASHRRVRELDSVDPAAVQDHALLQLVRRASQTRFGLEHGFHQIRTVKDYQERVPVRDYEAFWNGYWKASYPTMP